VNFSLSRESNSVGATTISSPTFHPATSATTIKSFPGIIYSIALVHLVAGEGE
jgi:hypothetical protein